MIHSVRQDPGASITEAHLLFRRHQSFVLTTHVNPDGDGLGSEIALSAWLSSRGKQVTILNHNETPSVYRFLDPENRIFRYDPSAHEALIRNADVIVVLDTNHPGRLSSLTGAVVGSPARKICIDHHLDPARFADLYVLDAGSTSTGEIVYRLLDADPDGAKITPSIASALYCAIMTDTGSFRYSNVDPDIHRIVAHLLECGADPTAIYREVYEQWTAGRIQLLGETLASLRVEHHGLLAHVSVDQGMLQRTGTQEADTDNFTIYPMSVDGIIVGILFLELKSGVKMSLRSRGDIPINELAKEFGGNGHKNAAGARVDGISLEDFRKKVLIAAEKYLS